MFVMKNVTVLFQEVSMCQITVAKDGNHDQQNHFSWKIEPAAEECLMIEDYTHGLESV